MMATCCRLDTSVSQSGRLEDGLSKGAGALLEVLTGLRGHKALKVIRELKGEDASTVVSDSLNFLFLGSQHIVDLFYVFIR